MRVPQRPLDRAALAEPATVRAAAHDLDRDPVLHAVDKRDDRAGGQRNRVEIGHHGRLNPLGQAGEERARHAGGHGLVETGHVHMRQPGGQAQQSLLPVGGRGPLSGPDLADARQHFLAVAEHEQVDETGQRLRVEGARPAGDHQRMRERPILRVKGHPAQVENREQVGRTEVVLQCEPKDVEVGQGSCRLQARQRQPLMTQAVFHVASGGEYPFAGPVGQGVHRGVKHLEAVVAHADFVAVGKGQAELAPELAAVLHYGVELSAHILGGRLDPREHAAGDFKLQRVVGHRGRAGGGSRGTAAQSGNAVRPLDMSDYCSFEAPKTGRAVWPPLRVDTKIQVGPDFSVQNAMQAKNQMIAAVRRIVLLAGFTTLFPTLAVAQGKAAWDAARNRLVDEEIVGAGVKNPRVVEAMRQVPRHEFVPLNQRKMAYYDMALPIGEGQTISPPFIVASMTEQIDPRPSDKVLEIGTGSGYQAAVLGRLVREVYTIEIVQPLGQRAAAALRKLGYSNVHARVGDGYKGWPEKAPFDKIIVTCSPEKVPPALASQLKDDGLMVIPVGERYQQTLYLLRKKDGKMVIEAQRPTLFVPMTGQAEARRAVLPDPARPELRNGDFEEVEGKPPQVTGWHYQRQMEVVSGDAPSGKNYVVFKNSEPGRGSQALQGFAVDGRKVKQLEITLRVRGQDLRPAQTGGPFPRTVVTFFDENRATVGEGHIGLWRGTFGWQLETARIAVPPRAREAIFQIGLLGHPRRALAGAARADGGPPPGGERRGRGPAGLRPGPE